MLIGGLVPCSFVDFPGRLAAVVFLHGCNLRCGYCHNPQLVVGAPARRIARDALMRFLAARRGPLGGVVVTGGEPTLAAGLDALLRELRGLGFAVKLDTNGTRPAALRRVIDAGLVDYVAMDLKDVPEDYAASAGIAVAAADLRASIALLRGSGIAHELRTTVALPLHDRARLLRMALEIGAGGRWRLQRFRPGEVLDPRADLRAPEPALLDEVCSAARSAGLDCAWR